MSDQEQETQETTPEGDTGTTEDAPETQPEPTTATTTPNDAEPEQGDGEPKTDQEQGVGLTPTEPGDAGEGNPGTHFQTTEEIEAADLSKSGEVGGVS